MNDRYWSFYGVRSDIIVNGPTSSYDLLNKTFQCRLPKIFTEKYFNHIQWKYSKHCNDHNNFKQLLHEITNMNEMWTLYDIIFDYIGYNCLQQDKFQSTVIIRNNAITKYEKSVMRKYKSLLSERTYTICQGDEGNGYYKTIEIERETIENKYSLYCNVPFVPEKDDLKERVINSFACKLKKGDITYRQIPITMAKTKIFCGEDKLYHYEQDLGAACKRHRICHGNKSNVIEFMEGYTICDLHWDKKKQKWIKGRCCQYHGTCKCRCIHRNQNLYYAVLGGGCCFDDKLYSTVDNINKETSYYKPTKNYYLWGWGASEILR